MVHLYNETTHQPFKKDGIDVFAQRKVSKVPCSMKKYSTVQQSVKYTSGLEVRGGLGVIIKVTKSIKTPHSGEKFLKSVKS